MTGYLTHYYSNDTGPFQSLSALPDEEALKIMQSLCDDTPYGARFKDPAQYLKDRKKTERMQQKHPVRLFRRFWEREIP